RILVTPGVAWIEYFRRYAGTMHRDSEPEDLMCLVLHIRKLVFKHCGNKRTGIGKIHSLTYAVRPTGPTGIHKPDVHVGVVDFAGEHLRVSRGVEWHEGCTETCRESIDGFINAGFRSCY